MFFPGDPLQRSLDFVRRNEIARLTGSLVRAVHDLELAEKLAHEIMSRALQVWAETGAPENPGSWLGNAAQERVRQLPVTSLPLREVKPPDKERPQGKTDRAELRAQLMAGDDVLQLMLLASHPVLELEARTALLLRLVGGLTTSEIADAYQLPEVDVARRLAGAKCALSEARVALRVPRNAEFMRRMHSMRHTIFAVFDAGYSGRAERCRPLAVLCEEAMSLGRTLAELAPGDPEAFGLLALMELQASRMGARLGAGGEYIALADQDRTRWDYLMVGRGSSALDYADRLGAGRGPFALRAAIETCHARARSIQETDWASVAELYEALMLQSQSAEVALDLVDAVARAFGPAQGLKRADELLARPKLASDELWGTRGELLCELGRYKEAKEDFERAAATINNPAQRALMLEQAQRCAARIVRRPMLRLVK